MPFIGSSPAEVALTTGDLGDDIVTLAKIASGTDGELITWDASGNPAAVGAGTSGHFLKSQGAGSVPVFAEVSGGLVQTAYVLEGSTTTTTAALPIDTSIPQISEGGEIMTLAITPTSASNKLIIHVHANVGTSDTGGAAVAAALFQDSTANALCVGHKESNGSNELNFIDFSFAMTAGTTSSTTFKVRGGYAVAVGTTTFNGQGGAVRGGGVYYSSIVIQEVT
tara:strand:- start:1007 stop:1678 length:672 start_codon:yes stop_codon:yes gene_type:complete